MFIARKKHLSGSLITLTLYVFVSAGIPLSSSWAQDAAPKLINYQGRLTDAAGAALADGQYRIVFGLYSNATTTNAVWKETNQAVNLSGGVFSVALGSVTPLGTDAFGEAARYLQTTIVSGPGVTNEQTLLPRQQMASVPYALVAQNATNSANAAKLDGQAAAFYMPPGGVIAYGGTNEPAGWLVCDGRPVSRTNYPALFAAIGTAHGVGDGSATFNLPDYRGRFLRGVSGDTANDPDRNTRTNIANGGATGNNVGSYQGDEFKSHQHQFGGDDMMGDLPNGFFYTKLSSHNYDANSAISGNGGNFRTKNDSSNFGGNETRPRNVYVNYLIKY